MRVAAKFATGYGILITVLVGLLLYHMVVIQQAVQASRRLSVAAAGLTAGSLVQLQQLDRVEDGLSKYRVVRDREYLVDAAEAFRAFGTTMTTIESLPLAVAERTEVERMADLWRRARSSLLEAQEMAAADTLPGGAFIVRTPVSTEISGMAPSGEMLGVIRTLTLLPRLREQTRRLNDVAQQTITTELAGAVAAARRAERVSVVVLPLLVLFSLIVGGIFVRSISRSIRRLTQGAKAVARGDFAHRLEVGGNDEFTDLAEEFNRMTQRLGELDQAKQDFLSHVSHELRTPLSSMQEVNRLLLEELPGSLNPKQRELLSMNLGSEKRLSSMISKLLSLSRFDAGRIEYEFRSHDLRELVEDALQEFRSRVHGDPRSLDVSLPDEPIRLECDRELVVTVLENLLENAFKWSPPKGRVRIALAHDTSVPPWVPEDLSRRIGGMTGDRGVALFAVSDEGPGVPDEEKGRIFERFQQGRHGGQKRRAGVGLGLALSLEIVRGHGGAIWVTDRPGTGSVFHVALPGASRGDEIRRREETRMAELSSRWGSAER